jgi:hypothetical protein
MTESDERRLGVRRRLVGCAFGLLTLALGVCVRSPECGAAGASEPSPVPPRALLASTNALSESAMSQQTGTGLRPPAVISNDASGSPRVLLWDELRLGPLLTPPPDGTVTGGGK